MRLNLLMYAIEIERCGSINKAAQNLYLSQSNLSASIKSLEEDLGYRIFHRTPSGISVTPEGYYFLQSAKAIESEMNTIRQIPEIVNQLANISISSTWSSRFLQCFIGFKKDNQPDTRDSFKETGLIQNFKDVQSGSYRMSILYCFHSRTKVHMEEAAKTNLVAEVIQSHIPAVALVREDHPLAKKKSVTRKEIHEYPLVLFEDFEDEDWIDILEIPPHQRILYLFDKGAIVDAINYGEYISVTKQGAVLNDGINNIVELPISDLEDDLDIVLLRRRTYELNYREEEFLEYLKNYMTREMEREQIEGSAH
ncbi:MAG: LysR family transcriptional regulator [Firmicutes bacterium]|nr:LysR family transcriptional regulator [Bacillota bacterium]